VLRVFIAATIPEKNNLKRVKGLFWLTVLEVSIYHGERACWSIKVHIMVVRKQREKKA
jgi:hypothetical protein